MAVNNATVLDQIWLNGTNDYQQRVPKATQAGITATMKAIYADRGIYNQFVDALVNRIGRTIIHQRRWENPLALFKIGKLEYGDSIQEVANKLIKARGYDLDAQTLLKVNRPESKVFYHNVNRKENYPITINDVELKRAFLNDYGLNNYINSILEIPFTSDNYDEYQIMVNLIGQFEANTEGFFKVNVSAVTDESTSKALLKQIRTYIGKLRFLSAMYNRAGIPNHSNPDDLILITTPEVKASLDVDALAQLFHLEKAEIQTRIVEIEEFPIAGAQALLVDKDWFVCADFEYETTSFYNPETLSTNYWLHHWGLYSVSPFMNAVLFTTTAATNPPVVEMTPSGFTLAGTKNGIAIVEGTTTVTPNDDVKIYGTLSGSVTTNNADVVVAPDSFVYTLSAYKPGDDAEAIGTATGTGITAVNINETTFGTAVNGAAGTYEFTCISTETWTLGDQTVNLATYGITFTGVATNGDKITVEFTPAVPDTPIQLSTRTYIDSTGKLHIQKNIPIGTNIIIAATCTYNDPSGRVNLAPNIPFTDKFTVTIG